jgi:hypothetical protein
MVPTLQANYRFVVSDAVDLQAHARDPDRMFDWDDVLQVSCCSQPLLNYLISVRRSRCCAKLDSMIAW